MSQRLVHHILLMLFSPALGLYQAFQHRSRALKQWALIAFITLYGSVITLTEGKDGYRHWQKVYDHYVGLKFSQFWNELLQIVTLSYNKEVSDDPYIHVLSYFVAGFLGAPGLFFTFVAFIYAYFFSKSLFRLFEVFPKFKYSKLFFGFAMVFLLWKSIEGINTVRTWTGLWILFYGSISYYQTGKKKYMLLMFVPPLIHIGYMAMALPAWGVLVLGVRRWLYAALFFLSFATTMINPDLVTNRISENKVGQSKVQGYYVEEEPTLQDALEVSQGKTWYKTIYTIGVQNWAVALVAATLIIFGAYFRDMTKLELYLFSIGIVTYAFANTTWFLYTVAERSNIIAGTFILAALLLMWQRAYFEQRTAKVKLQRKMLFLAFILFIPFVVYRLADLIYFVSAFVFITPFLPWIDYGMNVSIREALGILMGS